MPTMTMKLIFPEKLNHGDIVCVISPSKSIQTIGKGSTGQYTLNKARENINNMGLKVISSTETQEVDIFGCLPLKKRLEEIHSAFSNPSIKCILTAIGGFHANQLIPYLDYELIRNNPKIFCGYSDITLLSAAILKKSGLVTYSGPHYSTFGMNKGLNYTIQEFQKCLFQKDPWTITASGFWSEDEWFLNQEDRIFKQNKPITCIQDGTAEGSIIAGNLTTLHLLQGTEYMPEMNDVILILEDLRSANEITRTLVSLLYSKDTGNIKGLIFGRSPSSSKLDTRTIKHILEIVQLKNIPIAFGIDIGHTTPHTTIPFGGFGKLICNQNGVQLTIIKH
jgi:muramoyltetrapeptide carboxypeptidase